MELWISQELAQDMFAKLKKNPKLARAMARQFMEHIEPSKMAEFLLSPEVAENLLATRIQQDPGATILQLQQLPKDRTNQRAPGKPTGRSSGQPAGKSATSAARGSRAQNRRRLSVAQVSELKRKVQAFLARHPWSTRKELTGQIDLPTQAIYRRIMTELQDAGLIRVRGKKAQTTYALKGVKTASSPAKTKAAPKPARSTRTGSTKKSAAKKASSPKRVPVLCPVPGCPNKGAPVFGMLCKEHKGIPAEQRAKLFAARRDQNKSPQ